MKLSAIDEYSTFLYHQGTNYASYRLFGAHFTVLRRKPCVRFAVWAPHAQQVSVVGDFNHWDADANPMERSSGSTSQYGIEIDETPLCVARQEMDGQPQCLRFVPQAHADL